MLNTCFNSLNAVNKNVKTLLGVFSVLLLSAAAAPSPAPSAADPLLPELAIQEVQKGPNGNQYQAGDRISLQVTLKAEESMNENAITLGLPKGGPTLEDQGWYLDPNTQTLNGTLRFIVSPVQVGPLTLPSLFIAYGEGKPFARTSTYSIQVSAPKSEPGAKPELLPIIAIGLPFRYWLLLFVSTAILTFLGYQLYQRYRKNQARAKPVHIPVVTPEPDHVIALQKIDQIFASYPFSIPNLKPVSFGCSEVLKEFFSRRFKIDAAESTTDEMIELLRREALNKDNLKEIQNLFLDLDLIKFTSEENYQSIKEEKYLELKVKSQMIVQKWKLQIESRGETP